MLTRIFLLLLALTANSLRAEIWQSPRWALLGSASGNVGYDSNLTLNNEGTGSAFFSAEPALRWTRHGSATKLDIRLAANLTHFLDDEELQTDGAASVVYAFPAVENRLPRFTGAANWRRFTAGNASLGRRITADAMDARFDGRIYSTGKLGVHSGLSFSRQDYSSEDLNLNQRLGLTLGAGYEPDPNKEITLNFLAAIGSSDPDRLGMAAVRSRELGLTLQGRGRLAAKVTGSLYVGAAAVRYTRAFERSDVLPVAGGEVVWLATSRSRVMAGLDVGADFSPEGESLAVQRLTLAFEQTIYGPWRWRARAAPAMVNYFREERVRRDRSVGGGLSLIYDPSERLDVTVSYDFTNQRSDRDYAAFQRHLALANLNYRF